jgi:serine/threonine protein kinase
MRTWHSLLRRDYNARNDILAQIIELEDHQHPCLTKYQILDFAGSGTFGTVFLAADRNARPCRFYAIKSYRQSEGIGVDYGRHEIDCLREVGGSPYITELVDAATTLGGTILVMPFYAHEPFEVRCVDYRSLY